MPLPAVLGAALGTVARGAAAAGRGAATKGGWLLDRAWSLDAGFNLASRLFGDTLPQFQHAITVIVVGGPQADLRRVWYLCAAVAFGRMKRSPALNGGSASMQATWDVSGKGAQIEIVLQSNATVQATRSFFNAVGTQGRAIIQDIKAEGRSILGLPVAAGFGALAPDIRMGLGLNPKQDPIATIQVGPDQISIGAGWPDFLRKVGQKNQSLPAAGADPVDGKTFIGPLPNAIQRNLKVVLTGNVDRFGRNLLREWPAGAIVDKAFRITGAPHRLIGLRGTSTDASLVMSSVSGQIAPFLPDDGRIVTTGEKTHTGVQPPRPLLDGATRTSLVALIAADLHTPCYLPQAPELTNMPRYSKGLHVHSPGDPDFDRYDDLSGTINNERPQFAPSPGRDEPANAPSDKMPDGIGQPETVTDFRGDR